MIFDVASQHGRERAVETLGLAIGLRIVLHLQRIADLEQRADSVEHVRDEL